MFFLELFSSHNFLVFTVFTDSTGSCKMPGRRTGFWVMFLFFRILATHIPTAFSFQF
uniref:Uncharacterized protein n=1 Tax=Anguilla anguilla TaxID=7936 RepID=A0A0E9XL01_ANGAN